MDLNVFRVGTRYIEKTSIPIIGLWIIIRELNIQICFFVSGYSFNVLRMRRNQTHEIKIPIKWRQ